MFRNGGIGHCEGTIPDNLREMGYRSTVADFLTTIGVSKVDILDYSLILMVTQYIAVD